MERTICCVPCLLAIVLTSCGGPKEEAPVEAYAEAPPALHFTDITSESGIDMTLTSGRLPSTQILEVKGAGLALIDYNKNGWLDLFIPNGATLDDTERGPGWRLYENLGGPGIRFKDVSVQAGITHTRWALGATVGDIDGDGFDDIHVTCYGPNVMLRNTGANAFVDVTPTAGVGDPRWSTSSAFGDVSGDGMLDLYVVNYLEFDAANPPPPSRFLGMEVLAGPRGLPPQADALYRNQGDGTFEDVSVASGIAAAAPMYGLGVVILDFDNDGRQDIYVGNDSMPNFMFHNQGDMRFVEVGARSGIASNVDGSNQATMGIGIGDVNGNGLPDVFTTNFSSDMNTLHVNLGNMSFEDQTQRRGLGIISRPFLGWACGFYDLDLDGHEELLMVNGHVYPQATRERMDSDYEQPPLLFKRRGERYERFAEPSAGEWLNGPARDRAMVFADLDDDGDIDLIIGEMNGPVRVLRNHGVRSNSSVWLIVELQDNRPHIGNRRGLGSRVEWLVGEARMTRWIYGGGFMSNSPPYAHFGRHGAESTGRVRITWPDGTVQEEAVPSLNARMTVVRQ